jgi:hypothetical protein
MPVAHALKRITGLKESTRRAIVFLEGSDCEASAIFSGFSDKTRRDVLSRFDYWIDGGINDNYFHGWPNLAAYKDCFSFRWREKKVRCRFYGFFYHPHKSDARFQVCVLTGFDRKTQEETDFTILDIANRFKNDPYIKKLLEAEFYY